jgi:hypothetical protein
MSTNLRLFKDVGIARHAVFEEERFGISLRFPIRISIFFPLKGITYRPFCDYKANEAKRKKQWIQ